MNINDFDVSPIFQERLTASLFGENRSSVAIAKDMGISKDILIRALKTGLIPSTKSLIKITDYTEDSIDYLIDLTDKNHTAKTLENVTFHDRLKELKERNDIKYGTIAAKLGISRSLFNSWEQHKYTPSLEITYQIANFFKVSIDYLLARTDIENYRTL
jgi:hypothetical protein cdifQ_04001071